MFNQISDFECLAPLGHGRFGQVYKMKSKMDGQIYAVKMVKKPGEKINLKREKYIMGQLSHPNIVKLYGTFEDSNYIYFVSELIQGKNLEVYVQNFQQFNPNKHIEQKIIIHIFKQILITLNFLHENGIIHRDIKPDNILIDNNNNIKITDFGISAIYKNGYGDYSYNNTVVGRSDFLCPEMINNQPYDYRCDIFCLGYTIYYMMYFTLPSISKIYKDNSNNEKIHRIDSLEIKDTFYNKRLIKLVKSMFSNNPYDRPNISFALKELNDIENEINNIQINNFEYYCNNNNINNNINNNNNYYQINSQVRINNIIISSMKCILQFFSKLENMNSIKTMVLSTKINNKNNYFIHFFLNILDITEKYNNGQMTIMEYNNNIIEFINQLWSKKIKIEGSRPIVLYYNILYNFKKESNKLINWVNKLGVNQYNIPNDLPQSKFPNVYDIIDDFIKDYKCPLVDVFYFILLIYKKCPNCDKIFRASSYISSMFALDNKQQDSINNLIRNYFNKKNILNDYIVCNCGFSGNLIIEEKALFNSPDYLLLDLDEGGKVNYDLTLDLSQYIKTNLGPRKYYLFAVFNKENVNNNNTRFVATMKEGDKWSFFSGDSKSVCGEEALYTGNPSCAIYKKMS